jgi:hypothetical protein
MRIARVRAVRVHLTTARRATDRTRRLGDDDVFEKVAQVASCLAPRIFASALATVRQALAQASTSAPEDHADARQPAGRRLSRAARAVTFEGLVKDHKILLADKVVGWLEDVERTLDSSAEFRANYEAESVPAKCAIFYWVCQALEV